MAEDLTGLQTYSVEALLGPNDTWVLEPMSAGFTIQEGGELTFRLWLKPTDNYRTRLRVSGIAPFNVRVFPMGAANPAQNRIRDYPSEGFTAPASGPGR